VSMIKGEINSLMQKMDNASKSIFESYDFNSKNLPVVEDTNKVGCADARDNSKGPGPQDCNECFLLKSKLMT